MREVKYTDTSQTKERKKFILLCFLLILLTAVCLFITTFALAAKMRNMSTDIHVHYEGVITDNYFEYAINTDGKTLTLKGFKSGLTSYPKTVNIPTSCQSKTVTIIGDNAFDGNTTITSVTLPAGITSIGDYAFRGISNLATINYNITSTSSYIISSTGYPFYEAGKSVSAGITVTFGADVTKVTDHLFGTTASWNVPNIKTVKFSGNKLYSIGDSAFKYCSSLTSITIPSSVTSIGNEAFYYCKGLTDIVLPNGLRTIGDEAFRDCSGLTSSITISSNVTSIGDRAFDSCYGVTVTFSEDSKLQTIGYSAFQMCKIKNQSLKIPNSVITIEDYAFNACHLVSVTIGSGVTSIGYLAFWQIEELTEVIIESQTVCRNLASWEGGSYTNTDLIDYATTVKAKYTITDYSKLGLTSHGLQSDGYYLYTK